MEAETDESSGAGVISSNIRLLRPPGPPALVFLDKYFFLTFNKRQLKGNSQQIRFLEKFSNIPPGKFVNPLYSSRALLRICDEYKDGKLNLTTLNLS